MEKTSIKHKALECRGPTMPADHPTCWLASPANQWKWCKNRGQGLASVTLTYAGKLAVNHICAILTQGANNSKLMEVVDLQLTRP